MKIVLLSFFRRVFPESFSRKFFCKSFLESYLKKKNPESFSKKFFRKLFLTFSLKSFLKVFWKVFLEFFKVFSPSFPGKFFREVFLESLSKYFFQKNCLNNLLMIFVLKEKMHKYIHVVQLYFLIVFSAIFKKFVQISFIFYHLESFCRKFVQ